MQQLKPSQLKKKCPPQYFDFQTTAEIEPLTGMIGQDRAQKAMKFGLGIKSFGYNIFVSGMSGTGKLSYTMDVVKSTAALQEAPDDICYVNSFNLPDQPITLMFPSGMGRFFAKKMDEMVTDLYAEIPKAFSSKNYEKNKVSIIDRFKKERDSALEKLNIFAAEHGFAVKWVDGGYATIPIIDGKTINEDEYLLLNVDTKKEIDKKATVVSKLANQTLQNLVKKEKKVRFEIEDLDEKTALFTIDVLFEEFLNNFPEHAKLREYIEEMRLDILDNLIAFREFEGDDEDLTAIANFKEKIETRYQVNLFIDNSIQEGAPVIFEDNPTLANLIGKLEYENNMGVASTNFLKIKAGALHKANGGYLILPVRDLLTNPQAYEALKRALKSQSICIENAAEMIGVFPASSLKPEAAPLKIKIILIGSPHVFEILSDYDEDFSELFKIKVDFDDEIDYSKKNCQLLAKFIASHCIQENIAHCKKNAVVKIVEHCSLLAESQKKLTTKFSDIVEVLHEANMLRVLRHGDYIERHDIENAIFEKKKRLNRYEEKVGEMYADQTILMEVNGYKIGQINGLSVMQAGDYTMGQPARITVNTWAGQRGVVNIERESELSGKIHSKGVNVLSGWFCEKFASNSKINFSASICFEQNYYGIDGDSASSTEIYALLSSLSLVPINQGIAVTGSVNQKGYVQPIGGVNYKIQGFFNLCKLLGFNPSQGVMIPKANIDDLVLDDEIISAVRKGTFNIWYVERIEEGIELLTGKPASTPSEDESHKWGEDSIYGRIERRLAGWKDENRLTVSISKRKS